MQLCDFPRCRNTSHLGYIESEVCTSHWEQLCSADSKTEKRMLKRIGLLRNKRGAVVIITQDAKY